jgi:hypothetical protein
MYVTAVTDVLKERKIFLGLELSNAQIPATVSG